MIIAPAFPQDWTIQEHALLAETHSSFIWKVRLLNDEIAIVKEIKIFDDSEDELRGAHYLNWHNGGACVRMLDFQGRQMLLEYAGDKTLTQVTEEQSDNYATNIAAEVIKTLLARSDKPAPAQLQPLRERFHSLFNKARHDQLHKPDSFYVKAAKIAERLLDNQQNVRMLHGDIHHDNILLSQRGWLVIDPKGLYGDMGYDTANMFYNPLHQPDLTADPARIAYMANSFAQSLKQSPRHLLDYAVSYGALSASWHAEDCNTEDEAHQLQIATAILNSRNQFFK